jgi:hypothetical protein
MKLTISVNITDEQLSQLVETSSKQDKPVIELLSKYLLSSPSVVEPIVFRQRTNAPSEFVPMFENKSKKRKRKKLKPFKMLSSEEVCYIRSTYKQNPVLETVTILQKELGCSRQNIEAVVLGRTWVSNIRKYSPYITEKEQLEYLQIIRPFSKYNYLKCNDHLNNKKNRLIEKEMLNEHV